MGMPYCAYNGRDGALEDCPPHRGELEDSKNHGLGLDLDALGSIVIVTNVLR